MENTYSVMIEGIYGVRNARSLALRKCVREHRILHHEFMKATPDLLGLSTDEYVKRVDNFIREKVSALSAKNRLPEPKTIGT